MDVMKPRLTYTDYVALPDDGRRYEILVGELAVTPAPGRRHQEIVGELFSLLHGHVKARGLGQVFVSPFDVILAETSVVQPDIVYVAIGRLGIVSERGVEGAPRSSPRPHSSVTAAPSRSSTRATASRISGSSTRRRIRSRPAFSGPAPT
jgi:hypothetical protein